MIHNDGTLPTAGRIVETTRLKTFLYFSVHRESSPKAAVWCCDSL